MEQLEELLIENSIYRSVHPSIHPSESWELKRNIDVSEVELDCSAFLCVSLG